MVLPGFTINKKIQTINDLRNIEKKLLIYFLNFPNLINKNLNFFLDIQEFYELTLLDESKSIQQKTAETLLIASKWEQENSIKLTDVS